MRDIIYQKFHEIFGVHPNIAVKAPGRINLIGEHTDYNEGFVLPSAVNLGIYAVFAESAKSYSEVYALDMDESYRFDVNQVKPLQGGGWKNYLLGVVHFLQRMGKSPGQFRMVFAGDIPRGSGMSSSAALENAISFGLNQLFALNIDRASLAKVGQNAEHEFVGVKCGIMDQFSSMLGKKDHAMLLDCRSLNYEMIPFDLANHQLLLINSNVHHNLADSQYNVRRSQCEEAVAVINEKYSEIRSLRDVAPETLEEFKDRLNSTTMKRCQYVLKENQRVLDLVDALKSNNLGKAGELLKEGQQGMADEYEITCAEIDFLSGFANRYEGILGSRMMGGGFGGCTISLIRRDIVEKFVLDISKAYKDTFEIEAKAIMIEVEDGTRLL